MTAPHPMNRRGFLKSSAALLGTSLVARAATGPAKADARPIGANGDIRVAIIGVGRKGSQLVENVLQVRGARLVAICDVDPRTLAQQREELAKKNVTLFARTEVREVLARPDVDAVVIASPNHWHALHTVWACQAGKDVYVEKPVSHNPWEAVQMSRAARRHGRVVQVGTQMRSDVAIPQVIDYLRRGELGKIQWIHALCYKYREGIGRRLPWYPDWLDYDQFCGPAPLVPLVRNELHYDWHWFWATGNGAAC
jgi:predicted dehydrogenase